MPSTFDPINDFAEVADSLEPVTLRRRASGEEISVTAALRRGMVLNEAAASDGKYLATDVRWHLPISALSTQPAPGDQIIDAAGNDYTILSVQEQTTRSRWLATSRDLAIAFALCERIDVQKATVTQGAMGEETIAWHDHLPGIRARIQPLTTQVHSGEDRRTSRTTHVVYVTEPLAIDAQHRIVAADGRVFRIVDYRQQEQLGDLAEIHVFLDIEINN